MKNKIKLFVTGSLLAVSFFSFYRVSSFCLKVNKANNIKHITNDQMLVDAATDDERLFTMESWRSLKTINNDFKAFIQFPDRWIEEPIVQGTDNSFYLTHDLNKNWSEFGSVYLDAKASDSDRNITIYGHNVFMGGDLMFTPLSRLVDQNEYEQHHSFKIYWENECREYEITHVYYWDEVNDRNFDYKQTDFSGSAEFNEYKSWIDRHNLITSEVTLNDDSSFVSLQTCKDLSSTIRIIVTAKEMKRCAY